MNKITTFFRESYRELLEKVSWPTWTELQQSTVIVLVATVLITLVVGGHGSDRQFDLAFDLFLFRLLNGETAYCSKFFL